MPTLAPFEVQKRYCTNTISKKLEMSVNSLDAIIYESSLHEQYLIIVVTNLMGFFYKKSDYPATKIPKILIRLFPILIRNGPIHDSYKLKCLNTINQKY